MSSNLLISEPSLMVSPTLAKLIGLNEAMFLQQLHYWLNPRINKRVMDGRHWVHNTYEQWQQQFPFWSEKTIRRAIANLEDLNILASYISTISFKKTKFYSLNYDVLNSLYLQKNPKQLKAHSSGQINQEDLPKKADVGNLDVLELFIDEVDLSGHFDQRDLENETNVEDLRPSAIPQSENDRNSTLDQNNLIDLPNLTRSYNKDTETTSENTLLPPPHSSSSNLPAKEEKKDDDMDSLISVWNGIVQSKLETSPVFLTTKRRITLKSIFTHYFGSDKASWKAYCEKIAGTKFLMGQNDNGFKAGFDWSINPDNIVRIQEGAFYDKPIPEKETSEPSWEQFENALRERQTEKAYPFSWTNVCLSLARQTNQHVSTALFEKIHPENLSDSVARLIVPFQFICDQIRDRHLPKLKAAIRAEYPHVSDVFLEVGRTR